jgi:hypothetical protein
MRYDAEVLGAFVLPHIERNLCDCKPKKTLPRVYHHLDSAPAHNTKQSREGIARAKTTMVVHPGHSPDAAPNDLLLFCCLKNEMAGFTASSPIDILSEIRRIFQEISKETLLVVYGE